MPSPQQDHPDPRDRALQALLAIEAEGLGGQAALRASVEQAPALHGPDRALATELTYGVERRRRSLDAWIATVASRGLYGMELRVLTALRLGAYQLAHLNVPAHAAVHATVEMAKRHVGSKQIAFIHAVLRKLAVTPCPPALDVPAWIVQRIEDFAMRTGLDASTLVQAFHGQAPLHLQLLNPDAEASLQAEGVPLMALPVPGSFASDGSLFFRSTAFAARQALAQDAGSAAVVHWLGAQKGWKIADVAAGRGVKSVLLASLGAQVTAIDLSATKLVQADALAQQAGFPLIATVTADASQPMPLPDADFDAVLIDAPCTALGTLRRRPEVRHRRMAADLLRMADLQAHILANAARLVRPGGVLVHATCSFALEEGPLVIEAFLRDHPDFQRDPGDAAWIRPWLDAQGDLRTHPLTFGMDAFQATRLRRTQK